MLFSEHATFIKIDLILTHRKRFNAFQKLEIIQVIFSNHKGTQLQSKIKNKENPQLPGN